jgi:hypothetical protein
MYLQMLAAILPMPKAVQPLAAMMAPAAPRVWAAMLDLSEGVRVEGGRARARGVVPIVAEDQAICGEVKCVRIFFWSLAISASSMGNLILLSFGKLEEGEKGWGCCSE